MEVSFYGAAHLIWVVIPYFRRQRRGKILCISSLAGCFVLFYEGFYSVSKFALEGFCESLSSKIRKFRIWVSLIDPGDVRTPIFVHPIK